MAACIKTVDKERGVYLLTQAHTSLEWNNERSRNEESRSDCQNQRIKDEEGGDGG